MRPRRHSLHPLEQLVPRRGGNLRRPSARRRGPGDPRRSRSRSAGCELDHVHRLEVGRLLAGAVHLALKVRTDWTPLPLGEPPWTPARWRRRAARAVHLARLDGGELEGLALLERLLAGRPASWPPLASWLALVPCPPARPRAALGLAVARLTLGRAAEARDAFRLLADPRERAAWARDARLGLALAHRACGAPWLAFLAAEAACEARPPSCDALVTSLALALDAGVTGEELAGAERRLERHVDPASPRFRSALARLGANRERFGLAGPPQPGSGGGSSGPVARVREVLSDPRSAAR